MEVGGQGVGVSGHLAGQELRFPFRQNLHGARPAVGGVPDVVAVGLLGVSGLELRRVVVAPGDLEEGVDPRMVRALSSVRSWYPARLLSRAMGCWASGANCSATPSLPRRCWTGCCTTPMCSTSGGELQPQGETPGGAIPVATPSRRFAGGGGRNDATGRGVVEWKMWRS